MTDSTETGTPTYLAKNDRTLRFPARHTALLVIDPANDFLSEGGAAWDMVETTVKLNQVVENLKDAIEGARSRSIPVLFGPMALTRKDYAHHALQRRSGINRLMFQERCSLLAVGALNST